MSGDLTDMDVREAYVRGRGSSYGGSAEDGAIRDELRRRDFHTWLSAHDVALLHGAADRPEGAKTAPDTPGSASSTVDGPPTGYTELVEVLEALPTLVREKRRREGLSLRDAAEQAGISAATILRFERGDGVDFRGTALPLLKWVAS